ncbi:MAG: 30S ribosomal protein S21 [Planctomycetes bacterium]|nr:30S ribosomal protein S21 [Planctomycetota bacterium]
MGVRIKVAERETIGQALRRFKSQLEREGVAWELRRRGCFVDATEIRRAKQFQKKFKTRKAALLARISAGLSGPALDAARTEFWRRTGKP